MEATAARNQNSIRRKTKLWLQLESENIDNQTQITKQKQLFFNDLLNAVNNDFPKQHRHFFIKFILSNSIDSQQNMFSFFSRFKQFRTPPQKEISPLSVNPFIFTNQNQNFVKIKTEKSEDQNQNQKKRYKKSYSIRNKRIMTPAKRQNRIIFNKKNLLDLDRKIQTKYINNIADKLFLKSPLYYQKPQKLKRNVMLNKQIKQRVIQKRRFKTETEDHSPKIPSIYVDQLLKMKKADFYLLNRRSLITQYSCRIKY